MEQKKFFPIRNCKKEKRSADKITLFRMIVSFSLEINFQGPFYL
ncbi:hypothetical protein [Leptospira selangorensis]|nr:hypothetical protein [Leptospira selangorensis]